MKIAIPFLALLGVAAAAVGGYFWGKSQGEAGTTERVRLAVTQEVQRLVVERDKEMRELKESALRSSTNGDKVAMPAQFEGASLGDIFSSPGAMDRFQGVMAYVQNLPADQLESALEDVKLKMQGVGFDPEKMLARHLLLTRFGDEDPQAAMAYLKDQDSFTLTFGMGTVLSSLAAKDPAAAGKIFADDQSPLMNGPQGKYAASAIAREWARQDPEGALAWAKSLPDDKKVGAVEGIVNSMAGQDPLKAATIAMELPTGEDRNRVLGNAAEAWAAKDPAGALAWAGKLEHNDMIATSKRALAGWAANDAKAAAEYLNQESAPYKEQLLSSVAQKWALKKPGDAAAWVAAEPESEGKRAAVAVVMDSWVATDIYNSSDWLQKQPSGASKDRGIVSLSNALIHSNKTEDREAAISWAAEIQDSTSRATQIKASAKAWMAVDKAAAYNWITTSPSLTEGDREALLKN